MSHTEDQVTFRLHYLCRFDADVHAFVGYIPRLQVYAQSPTQQALKNAVHASALRFILACADRGILGDIMQESRMRPLSETEAESVVNSETTEYVGVEGYEECPEAIEVTVPLSVMTAQRATVA